MADRSDSPHGTAAAETDGFTRRDLIGAATAGAALAAGIGPATAQENAPMGLLSGKVAIVTGAARGIGLATAKAYAEAGAKVVMFDVADPGAVPPVEGFRIANAEEYATAIEEVRAIDPDTVGITGDVRNPDDLAATVARALEDFGGLDVAVANAGYVRWHPFMDGTPEDWTSVFDVNVHGVFNTFKAAGAALRERGGGSLISLSSIGGRQGVNGNGAYNASKWAVIGLTKQAALELGPEGIRANAIAPGPVNTPMYRSEAQMRSMGIDVASLGVEGGRARQDEMLNPVLPLGQAPASEPAAIARTALYLASDLSSDVSGAVIDTALGYNANYTA